VPYLTVEEYVRRVGAQETAQITNEARATPGTGPVIVPSKVESAIADASDVVDGYVGTRYALPLDPVPRLVIGWTAALAREFLFKNKPVAAVTEAADRVRSQLRDLSTRKIDLPVAPGATPPAEAGTAPAQTSRDAPAPTFGGGAMDRFMGAFGSGASLPCWRTGGR
jgi:phage gp36-like protein